MKTFKTIILLIYSLICASGSIFGQTIINDFEAGHPTTVERHGLMNMNGLTIVSNPNTVGNTTANCARYGRTGANWYELIGFDIDYTVAAGDTEYLHVLVNYPAQPDISVRFDSPNKESDGSTDVRALNTYSNFGQWQDLVFQIDGGASGVTVNAIILLPDVGFNNTPSRQVLNNTDAFGYIDELTFSTSSVSTLNVNKFELKNNLINVYPNPATSIFKIGTSNNARIVNISLYSVLGNEVTQNMTRVNNNEYDISTLSSGLYMMKIIYDQGNSVTKLLVKQ